MPSNLGAFKNNLAVCFVSKPATYLYLRGPRNILYTDTLTCTAFMFDPAPGLSLQSILLSRPFLLALQFLISHSRSLVTITPFIRAHPIRLSSMPALKQEIVNSQQVRQYSSLATPAS